MRRSHGRSSRDRVRKLRLPQSALANARQCKQFSFPNRSETRFVITPAHAGARFSLQFFQHSIFSLAGPSSKNVAYRPKSVSVTPPTKHRHIRTLQSDIAKLQIIPSSVPFRFAVHGRIGRHWEFDLAMQSDAKAQRRSRGRASLTFSARPSRLLPLSCATAASASA